MKPSRYAKKAAVGRDVLELLSSQEKAMISAAEARASALSARATAKVGGHLGAATLCP